MSNTKLEITYDCSEQTVNISSSGCIWNTDLASLENAQCAEDHGDEGQVEDEQGDDEGEQVHCQVTDDEEEDEGVDVLCGDEGAQPLDPGTRAPVHHVVLHLHHNVQGVLEHLATHTREIRRTHRSTTHTREIRRTHRSTTFQEEKEAWVKRFISR